MKKLLVGGLVGGLILFIWQFLSYGLLDLHYTQMAYTPAQEEIMEVLEAQNLEDGEYYMMRAPKGDQVKQNQLMEDRKGLPWAMIQYHNNLEHPFASNAIRALVMNTIAVLILCWILMQFAEITMRSAIVTAIGAGAITYCTAHYLDAIWFSSNSLPDLIDAVVPWILIGGWLGWWLRR